ncbi:MAG: segregation/condensation protein A [Saprospirales bacterium]|nr:segregation/condensation protein A [Saprospirales bacterium]
MNQTTYTIHLPQFEGPFDLLLFFIERDELDIHDIPIAKITDDFLAYIRQMEQMNIDLASEFILVAATLCRIKAKMLLPRKPVDEEGNEIDPREELVQRLLEYKRYKSVLDDMRKLEENRFFRHHRGNVAKELQDIATKALVDEELESVTLFKLLKVFERVIQRFENNTAPKTVHTVMHYPYTVQEQQAFILSSIPSGGSARFEEIFTGMQDRIHAIVTFLALLELLNFQRLNIIQGEGPNNFWISEGEAAPPDEVTPD